jgi:xylulokinase
MSGTPATVVVTLDIGGSAAKASAYDSERRVSLGQAAEPYPAAGPAADPGTFDPQGWWQAALGALRALCRRLDQPPGRYLGITVSAIRIPFVLADGRGEAVMPGLLNSDRRALPYVARVTAALGSAELYRLTGHWAAPEFGLPKLLWARDNHPGPWRAARTVLQLHDWFIYKLAGVIASEPSSAAMSQLLDVRAGDWASGLLSAFGIPASMMPQLLRAGSRAGGLLPGVASATGLAAGTPVHIGGGDTHLSSLSAGGAEGIPVVVAGTTAPAVLAAGRERQAGSPDELFPLLVSDHVVAGQRVLESNAGATGGTAMLLHDLGAESGSSLRHELAARGIRVAGGTAGEELTVLAGNPFFGPEGWASPAPPTVIGLRDTDTGRDVYLACLRGICLAIRATLGCLLRRSGTVAPFIVATGGMSRNPAWTQLLADVTGTRVHVRPLDRIAGRAGAIIVTGDRMPDSHAEQEGARVHEPRDEAAPAAADGYRRYTELYRAARPGAGPEGRVSRARAR